MKQFSYRVVKIVRVVCSLVTLGLFCVIFLLPDSFQVVARLQFIPSGIRVASVVGIAAVCCLAFTVLLTLLMGRLYCSFFCPVGAVQDIAIRLKNLLRRSKCKPLFTSNYRLLRYSFLVLLLAAIVMGAAIPLGLLDPFSVFGRFGSTVLKPGFVWLVNLIADSGVVDIYPREYAPFSLAALLVGASTLTLIATAAFFWNRLFCNTLCPAGALLGILSKFSWYKIGFDSDACIKCGKCAAVCKAGCIDFKNGVVDSERCVGCFNCLDVCGPVALRYGRVALRRSSSYGGQASGGGHPPALKLWRTGEASVGRGSSSRRDFMIIGGASAVGAVLAPAVLSRGADTEFPVMPPGAIDFKRFSSKCTGCQLCVSNCPGNVLKPALLQYGMGGFLQPRLDFDTGMCEFDCTVCSDICPSGALVPLGKEKKQRVQIGVAEFWRSRCVVRTDHTHCGACAEHCPTGAVHMVPWRRGGGQGQGRGRGRGKGRGDGVGVNLTIPQVEPELCIGCGACEFICPVRPVRAILVSGSKTHGVAEVSSSEQAVDHLEGKDFPF